MSKTCYHNPRSQLTLPTIAEDICKARALIRELDNEDTELQDVLPLSVYEAPFNTIGMENAIPVIHPIVQIGISERTTPTRTLNPTLHVLRQESTITPPRHVQGDNSAPQRPILTPPTWRTGTSPTAPMSTAFPDNEDFQREQIRVDQERRERAEERMCQRESIFNKNLYTLPEDELYPQSPVIDPSLLKPVESTGSMIIPPLPTLESSCDIHIPHSRPAVNPLRVQPQGTKPEQAHGGRKQAGRKPRAKENVSEMIIGENEHIEPECVQRIQLVDKETQRRVEAHNRQRPARAAASSRNPAGEYPLARFSPPPEPQPTLTTKRICMPPKDPNGKYVKQASLTAKETALALAAKQQEEAAKII